MLSTIPRNPEKWSSSRRNQWTPSIRMGGQHRLEWVVKMARNTHSEVVAAELARKDGENDEQKTARAKAWIANRVPDIRFLLDHLLKGPAWDSEIKPDPNQVGIVGHRFGGWTALAATEVDLRIRAVVALAPGGSSRPKPGILP